MNRQKISHPILSAILAAGLYALSTPLSKLLLEGIPPRMLAALLYLGAGLGMFAMKLVRGQSSQRRLTRRDLPYVLAMIALDTAAPILLMLGLSRTTPANASLLNNFEIVATSIIACVLFGETINRRLWIGIGLVTLSSMILSFEDASSLQFSVGSLFVLLACVCWGFENNCTRMVSQSDPLEIVEIKGFGSGIGSLLLAFAAGESLPAPVRLLPALLLGFIAYGLSVFFYVYAQRTLGAARTSAYYAIAPFIGASLSLLIFREIPKPAFLLALATMIAGTCFASSSERSNSIET